MPAPNGAALYQQHCAGCHGPLATSQKTGATAARIQTALGSIPVMMPIAAQLSQADIAAISLALTSVTAPAPNPTPAPPPTAAPCVDPMPQRRVWTLSRLEYDNSVRAVLSNTSDQAQGTFPADNRANGFSNNAQSQVVGSTLVNLMMTAAETIASQSLSGELTFIGTLGCSFAATLPAAQDACAINYINRRGAALFRRPLTTAEVTDLYSAYVVGFNNPITNVSAVNTGIQTLIATMLQMPQFFYRTELGPAGSTANPVQLTQHEIASSIAFMATGAPPDATLTAAASAGSLNTPAAISAQYQRLMTSAAGRLQMQRFVMQWLDEDQIANFGMAGTPVTPALAANMLSETQNFVTEAVYNGTGTVRELLTGNYTFVNTALATHYGLSTAGTSANGMTKVTLPAASSRGGLMSQGAFLVSNSKAGVPLLHRGIAVRNKVLCETLPSVAELGLPGFTPPPFVPPPAGTTTKQSLKSSIVGVCYTCHQYFQPIGYALEKFDSFGRFQSMQNGGVVDPSGEIVNSTVVDYVTGKISAPTSFTTTMFQDFHDMAAKLADHPRTNSCFSYKLVSYVSGRNNVGQNECAVEKTMKPPAGATAATVQQQFLNYVATPNFIMRSR